tara:strand:- start:188 stop:1336 length:1149 start_codon:yes stop_codon:yes gene_type:complete
MGQVKTFINTTPIVLDMADKKIDPGEIYIIGQYQVGTSTPTGHYKIGMTQLGRTSFKRLKEHQTGNPNRLFLHYWTHCEASYLVEKLMHSKWSPNRIGQEWFSLNSTELLQAITDITQFETQFGTQIIQLRSRYYATPTPGVHPSLTSAETVVVQGWRNLAFPIVEEMARLKYVYKTREFQILLGNGVNAVVDSVTRLNISPPSTEFKDSKLPAALKLSFMTKTRKNLDDFRFIYTANPGHLDKLDLTLSYWKTRWPIEFAAYETAKTGWDTMKSTINSATVNRTSQARTSNIETLHQEYSDAKIEYDNKEAERDALEIQVRILCMDYEGVANVCEWKRKSQSNLFDKGRFKVLNEADYLNPIYQGSSLGSVKPVLVAWKAY